MYKNLHDKKIILFDLDGTLAESRQPMTEEMGESIKKLLDVKQVAVISGAQFSQFEKQFLGSLPLGANLKNLILLPTSGAGYYVYDGRSYAPVYERVFSKQEQENIINALNEALEQAGFDKEEEIYGERIESRGSQITFSALGQQAPLEKKEKWDPHQEKRKKIVDILAPKVPDTSVKIGGTTSIDITKKGIDKAYGVEEVARRTGTPVSEMVYIGDALYEGGNDGVVKRTGIDTVQVSGPEETKQVISDILE